MKTAIILLIIVAALFAAFAGSHYARKLIRPKESLGRLFLYMLCCMALVFLITFVMVFVITSLFPGELIR